MKKTITVLLAVLAFIILNSSFLIHNCMCQWVQMNNGMGNVGVIALTYSGNNIYAATYYGVYFSTNNGTNWTQAGLSGNSIMSIAVSGNNIFAGAEDYPIGTGGVYLSTNNGTNWSLNLFTPIQNIWSLLVNGNTVFAGADNGIYLSTNNGTNWTQTSINNDYVYAFAVSGTNIFAGGDNGVYISTNNGTNWTLTSLQVGMGSFAVNGNNVFAGTWVSGNAHGVYLTTDNGTNWTQTALNNRNINSMAVSGNNVFAGTYQNGFYVSNNNGTNWTQRNEGITSTTSIFSLCILNNYIFAGTVSYGYRRPLSELVDIIPISSKVPEHYSLEQNYPNPFNPVTKIKFDIAQHTPYPLSRGEMVTLKVFDILGKEIATLVNEQLIPGIYEVEWNATNYTSGVYFYRLTAGEFTDTKRMLMIK